MVFGFSLQNIFKSNSRKLIPLRWEMFELTDDNGYIAWDDHHIPEEILCMILSYLPAKDLVFICRRVCKYWCNIVDSQVWKIKLAQLDIPCKKISSLHWFACFWIDLKSPLDRNFIKNNCGQEGFEHWEVLSSGGDGWGIEKPPVGCEKFPASSDVEMLQHNSCFVTSYYSCSKKQLIDLNSEGAPREFMDVVQPNITIGDWFCGRFDCSSVYELKVKLLNGDMKPLDDFELRKQIGSADGWMWHNVTHVFHGYGPGVKYIEFYHGGMDSQFWKGHYGSKITGASVTLSLP